MEEAQHQPHLAKLGGLADLSTRISPAEFCPQDHVSVTSLVSNTIQ